MKSVTHSILNRFAPLAVIAALVAGLVWPLASEAQNTASDPSTHKHAGQPTDDDLPAQIRELKAKAAALEATLEKQYPDAVDNAKMPYRDMMGGKGMGVRGGDDERAGGVKMMGTRMEVEMRQMESEGRGMGVGGGGGG